MNLAEKKVPIKKVFYFTIVLSLIVSISTGALVYAFSPGNYQVISGGVYPGAPSYSIFIDDGTYYAKNSYGAIVYSDTNAATVISDSLASGASVTLSEGTFTITESIIMQPSCTLIGQGEKTIILYAGAANGIVLDARDCGTMSIKDIVIDGGNIAGVRCFLSGKSSNSVDPKYNNYFYHVIFKDGYIGADTGSPSQDASYTYPAGTPDNSFVSCRFYDNSRGVILVNEGNTFTACVFSQNTFADVIITENGAGFIKGGVCSGTPSRVQYNFYLNTTLGDVSQLVVDGMYIENSAVSVLAAEGNGNVGILSIKDCWITTLGATYMIDTSNLAGGFISVTDNYATAAGGGSRDMYLSTQWLSGEARNNAGMTFSAASGGFTRFLLKENPSFINEKWGTATVTGSVSSVVVAHGLSVTPSQVQITALQAGQGKYWVSSTGATNFTITFDTQPSASTWYFYWHAVYNS